MLEYQLDLIAGPDSGRTLTIADGQSLVVGRGQVSDLQINDPRMSRAHFTLQVDAGKLIIRDNGSSGGTFVGQQRVTKHRRRQNSSSLASTTSFRTSLCNCWPSGPRIVTPPPATCSATWRGSASWII